MNRVDFYILPPDVMRDRYVCTIANKAWQNGNNVFIQTEDRATAELLDKLLWTYNDISFLPHGLYVEDEQGNNPVLIGWDEQIPDKFEVMINLAEDIPKTADHFARIIEIVTSDSQNRHSARNRYRIYRDRGYELHDHKMEDDYGNTQTTRTS